MALTEKMGSTATAPPIMRDLTGYDIGLFSYASCCPKAVVITKRVAEIQSPWVLNVHPEGEVEVNFCPFCSAKL